MKEELILLVENDPVIAVLTRLELEDLGYKVIQASKGEDAIQLCTTQRPAIVFMDFQLDGPMDGADAASDIIHHLNIPVIFLTGRSDPETVAKCRAVKPAGYLRKPCRSEELQKAINEALRTQECVQAQKRPFEEPVDESTVSRLLNRCEMDDYSPFAA